MPYTDVTFAQAKTRLANTLGDPAKVLLNTFVRPVALKLWPVNLFTT
jgi:hypothetical protein